MTALFRHVACAIFIITFATSGAAATPFSRPSGLPLSGQRFVRHLTPPAPPQRRVRISQAQRLAALAAGWQPITAAPPFQNAGHTVLMTNGEVFVQSPNSSSWYGLVPDATGSYIKGTWKQQASLPAGYAPLYYASAILPDGRLIISGGEYNGSSTPVWGTQSAIYDITRNAWTPIAPPTGWTTIGDAPSAVIANGTFVLGNCCTGQAAYLDPATLLWTPTGNNKAGSNNEEGWTLLPSGLVLTTDVQAEPGSETLNPANGAWTSAGILPVNVTNGGEIGPQILRQNGHVFVMGANGLTAIYNPSAVNHWTQGPTLPVINGQQLQIDDGPATLLPNGDVLMVASPATGQSPAYFLDFSANGTSLSFVPGPPNASNCPAFCYNLLLLPTGQVLATDDSSDVEIYTPTSSPNTAIAPVITAFPATIAHGLTYTISGTRFNGISQANAYGDDAQQATNYPLVQIINKSTGRVQYARTHAFSSMAVASPATVSTQFDVPSYTPLGASVLVVIANGISSNPVAVTVK